MASVQTAQTSVNLAEQPEERSASRTTDRVHKKKRELKLATPTHFDGDPKNLQKFLQDCDLYLFLNADVYVWDEDKIGFTLSYMTKGDAATWKEQYLKEAADLGKGKEDDDEFVFPTWGQFKTILREHFKEADTEADARYQLQRIKQGDKSITTHNAKFRLLMAKSGLSIAANNQTLVDWYQHSLKPELLNELWKLRPKPALVKDWMAAALEEENHQKQLGQLRQVMKPSRYGYKFTKEGKPRFVRITELGDEEIADDELSDGEITIEAATTETVCFNCNGKGHFA